MLKDCYIVVQKINLMVELLYFGVGNNCIGIT
jgi:hypothetical protein